MIREVDSKDGVMQIEKGDPCLSTRSILVDELTIRSGCQTNQHEIFTKSAAATLTTFALELSLIHI